MIELGIGDASVVGFGTALCRAPRWMHCLLNIGNQEPEDIQHGESGAITSKRGGSLHGLVSEHIPRRFGCAISGYRFRAQICSAYFILYIL